MPRANSRAIPWPTTRQTKGLRILAADEDESTLRATDELLAGLGHEVTAHAVTPAQAAELIAREDPDLSVVVVHDDDDHALDLIEEISEYARGPLIVAARLARVALRQQRRRARDRRLRAAAVRRRGAGRDRARR